MEKKVEKEEQDRWKFRLERKREKKKTLVVPEQKKMAPHKALGAEILT